MRDEPVGRLENWKFGGKSRGELREFGLVCAYGVVQGGSGSGSGNGNGNYPAMRTRNWRPGGAGVVLMRQQTVVVLVDRMVAVFAFPLDSNGNMQKAERGEGPRSVWGGGKGRGAPASAFSSDS